MVVGISPHTRNGALEGKWKGGFWGGGACFGIPPVTNYTKALYLNNSGISLWVSYSELLIHIKKNCGFFLYCSLKNVQKQTKAVLFR